jgi:hypothetical protein
LRLATLPPLRVGWTALDAGAGDARPPPERSWEAEDVEDDDSSEEALAGEGVVLEGGGVSRVDRGGRPMWGAEATVASCYDRVDCGRCW